MGAWGLLIYLYTARVVRKVQKGRPVESHLSAVASAKRVHTDAPWCVVLEAVYPALPSRGKSHGDVNGVRLDALVNGHDDTQREKGSGCDTIYSHGVFFSPHFPLFPRRSRHCFFACSNSSLCRRSLLLGSSSPDILHSLVLRLEEFLSKRKRVLQIERDARVLRRFFIVRVRRC